MAKLGEAVKDDEEDIRDTIGAAFDKAQEDVGDDEGEASGDVDDAALSLVKDEDDDNADDDAGDEKPADDDDSDDDADDSDDSDDSDDDGDSDNSDDDSGEAGDADVDVGTHKAPESWSPSMRENWKNLAPELQEHINSREQEIATALSHSAGERRLASQFKEAVGPYIPMLQSQGVQHPLQAVQQALGLQAQLSMGTATQKATAIAQLITRFGVDLNGLADVIDGNAPADGGLSDMIDQKLKPITDHFATTRAHENSQVSGALEGEFTAFATDPKNEFFSDVRADMTTLMAAASANGQMLSLQDAYSKSVMMRPDLQKILKARKPGGRSKSDIRKKKAASSSIRGDDSAPKSKKSDSVRGAIADAWNDQA